MFLFNSFQLLHEEACKHLTTKKVKSFPSLMAHRAALISVAQVV